MTCPNQNNFLCWTNYCSCRKKLSVSTNILTLVSQSLRAVINSFERFSEEEGDGTYHGEEDPKLRVHLHAVAIGEQEAFAALLLAREHDGDLLGGHRQHGQVDAVKLIETAPGARLGQPWQERKERDMQG